MNVLYECDGTNLQCLLMYLNKQKEWYHAIKHSKIYMEGLYTDILRRRKGFSSCHGVFSSWKQKDGMDDRLKL